MENKMETEQTAMTLQQLIENLKILHTSKALKLLKERNISYRTFSNYGHVRGETSGIPSVSAFYTANNYGVLEYFPLCTAEPGSVIEYEGTSYVLIYKAYMKGSVHIPTSQIVVLVDVNVFNGEARRYAYSIAGSYDGAIPWDEYWVSNLDPSLVEWEIKKQWDISYPEKSPHYVCELREDN